MNKYLIVSTTEFLLKARFPTLFKFLKDRKQCLDYTPLNQYTILFPHQLDNDLLQSKFSHPSHKGKSLVLTCSFARV